MDRFRHFVLAAVGLVLVTLTAAVISLGPALAQGGGGRVVPVVTTDAQGDAASIDREGALAVTDPRLTFGVEGLRVDPGDRCCPKPLNRFDARATAPVFVGEGLQHVFKVPAGKALLIHTLSTTGTAVLGRDGEVIEHLAVAFREPSDTAALQTAHANFPTGLVFLAGEEFRLRAFNGVNQVYVATAAAHGVLVPD